jgi:hypothetical protein
LQASAMTWCVPVRIKGRDRLTTPIVHWSNCASCWRARSHWRSP